MTPSEKIDPQLSLDTPEQIEFACDVLRVMRLLIQRMQMEGKKNWKAPDLIALLDTLMFEVTTGVTDEDRLRQVQVQAGSRAFNAGQARDGNPHDIHSQEFRWWDTGWHDAERQRKVAAGDTVTIQQGRTMKAKKRQPGRYYKIRLKEESLVKEWNDVLHQYSPEGQGSLFPRYDEAVALADKLKQGEEGVISVEVVDIK